MPPGAVIVPLPSRAPAAVTLFRFTVPSTNSFPLPSASQLSAFTVFVLDTSRLLTPVSGLSAYRHPDALLTPATALAPTVMEVQPRTPIRNVGVGRLTTTST